ncbi:MAG TPA: phosphopantetheine-binding protein, partial [Rhodothermales bacterium]|nr:phosphopantetheine-binding protein [Rhodothermales bacterium]
MTLNDILDMVALQLGQTKVQPDDHLYGDLGAESMDLVHLAIALEDRYQITLPEEDLADLRTVRDLY